MPALFTSTSSRPSRSSVSATRCSQSSHRPTWQAIASARRPVELAHLVGRGLAGVELARGDHDVGAGLGQRLHDGAADAARPTGDHRDLAGQVVELCEGRHGPMLPRGQRTVIYDRENAAPAAWRVPRRRGGTHGRADAQLACRAHARRRRRWSWPIPERRSPTPSSTTAPAAWRVPCGPGASGPATTSPSSWRTPRAFLEVAWAAQRSGVWYTAVNSHLRPAEVQYVLDDCGAKALVASEAMADVVAGLDLARIRVRLAAVGELPGFERTTTCWPKPSRCPADDEREGREMLYSSGTTGRPKGVRKDLPGTPFGDPVGHAGAARPGAGRPGRGRRPRRRCTCARRRCTTRRRSSTRCRCSAWGRRWW